jgi:acid phosphatase type 7
MPSSQRRSFTFALALLVVILSGCVAYPSNDQVLRDNKQPVGPRVEREGGSIIIAAAGDIACDPTTSNFNGGAGTSSACHMQQTSDLVLALHPDAVLVLGDLQYENGTAAKLVQSYDPTWGRLKAISYPTAGGGHDQYGFGDYHGYWGERAGPDGRPYYSFDLGAWHFISLSSNCDHVGGCETGSAQEQWLRADLAAHPTACTLAYWHQPRFSSGQHGSFTPMQPIWQALYDGGADIVLNGHDHDYERFAPQDPAGKSDPVDGIREFVVGTGGSNHYRIGAPIANSEVQDDSTFGVLKLTLHPTGYDWLFVHEPGKTFTDAGSTACH